MTSLSINQRQFAPLLEVFPQGIISIDLETTGLSPLVDKVIEVAAIKLLPEGVTTFEKLINPQIPIPPHTTDIHGITDEQVTEAPAINEVLGEFFTFVQELPIVAHNAKFDVGFLSFQAHHLKINVKKNPIYCSVKASRSTFKDVTNHKLGTLASELELPLENHHRAFDDALAALMLINEIAKKEKGPKLLKNSFLFHFSDFSGKVGDELPEDLKVLAKKAQNQVPVDIKYKGGSHKNKFRPIRPISLLPMPAGNILYAHCLLSNVYKSFALSKIQKVKTLNANEIKERLENLEKLKKE